MSQVRKSWGIIFPAMRISISLSLLLACILLTADMLGFTPDEERLQLDARKLISEALAIQISTMDPQQELVKLGSLLRLVEKHNPEIQSAGIRRISGDLVHESLKHAKLWEDFDREASSSSHILLPLLSRGKLWGNVELKFGALKGDTIWGSLHLSVFKLLLFQIVVSFFAYFVFMLKTLRQLDPSAVVPERVNAAFDSLNEGVMIIDEQEQILLANEAFAKKAGIDSLSLLGMKASELNWGWASREKSASNFPWIDVLKMNKAVTSIQLNLTSRSRNLIKFSLNASPISSLEGKPLGVLITFDDITELEERNAELHSIVQRLELTQAKVKKQNKELSYLATRDPMTGCLNRGSFSEQFDDLFAASQESGSELSCVMIDLDHFKQVNDNFGHATGDDVIKMLAEVLKKSTRKDDLVARYGGEEFCLVLPGMSMSVAAKVAERVRLRIKDESAKRYADGPRVTASLGVASMLDNPKTPAELNSLADEALYAAKQAGRNRVMSWAVMQDDGYLVQADQAETPTDNKDDPNVQNLKQRINELEDIASGFSSELEYSKSYDGLTGLPNETLFYDRIHQVIERSTRHDQFVAVLIVDIDMFSQINASLGRAGGDELLKQVAYRLNSVVRKSDEVSRLNVSRFAGDEFAVLLTDLSKKEQVTWAVKRILDAINQPAEIDGRTVYLTSHVGVSLYPTDADNVETLLNNAMSAKQYSKKHKSEFGFQFYDHHVQEQSLKHINLEAELRQAVTNEEWLLQYQPKWNVAEQKIVGVEALIRWNHPQRGIVSPYEFIEFAEQRNLIVPIGDWVMREACRQLRAWLDLGFDNCKMAINMSSVQLAQSDIADRVLHVLAEFKVPPRMFEIEITETILMDNVRQAIESLERLHVRGITITIDDFGTGYSSMGYLKTLPIDSLKIDRGFVSDICNDESDQTIVKALITMAHSMGMKVVAEGIEDSDQLKLLSEYGADEIQGYLLSRPVDAQVLEVMLKNPTLELDAPANVVQMRG